MSPRIKEALGFEPHELIGRKVGERTHPEDRKAIMELFADLLNERCKYGTVEYRPQHKSGGWKTFRATASPLYDARGKLARVIASSRDVTKLKRLENQLVQTEKLAAVGQMIAGVAHELNNPLTAIVGASELLKEKAPDNPTLRKPELVHRQARRAADLVQSPLPFSRPVTPCKVHINLADVAVKSLQLHEHCLRDNRILVELQPPPQDSYAKSLPRIGGDPNQLIQVLLNLITNSAQAIREARDSGTIRIQFGSGGNQVWMSLQDDGTGIANEALPRIFDPFFTTKRPGRGTGLGLSICTAIVREHGGNIEVHSTPGVSSRFTITLPIAERHRNDSEKRQAAKKRKEETSGSVAGRLEGCRMLVVDDEESIRDLVRDGLSSRGIVVDCAANSQEALALAAENHYDVILCDLKLHHEEGSELVVELRQRSQRESGYSEAAIILMTGDLLDSTHVEPLKLRGTRVLQKPFQISELVEIIREEIAVSSTVHSPDSKEQQTISGSLVTAEVSSPRQNPKHTNSFLPEESQ